ncbi:hypothetical protein HPB51_002968 [Rhipicephalus microplus]|uniref:Peptidase M13 N-terminal domain-containing protein n=1 Tax=Rhipicephalus microplus TaxID=6941 RepID=A0A9J6DT80_RHIMP|nr:hypothetical protein HPB51_002968 [Rhipicephalus microplus]
MPPAKRFCSYLEPGTTPSDVLQQTVWSQQKKARQATSALAPSQSPEATAHRDSTSLGIDSNDSTSQEIDSNEGGADVSTEDAMLEVLDGVTLTAPLMSLVNEGVSLPRRGGLVAKLMTEKTRSHGLGGIPLMCVPQPMLIIKATVDHKARLLWPAPGAPFGCRLRQHGTIAKEQAQPNHPPAQPPAANPSPVTNSPREPPIFSGLPGEDVEDWLDNYDHVGETEKLAMTRGSRKSVSTLAVNQSHQSSRYPDSMRDSTVKNAVNAANKKEKGKGAETVPARPSTTTLSAWKAATKTDPSKTGGSRRKPSAWETWKYPAYGFGGGVLFLVLTILLYRVMFPYPMIPTKFYSICETGGCAEFSRLIRSSLNTALDPCENFYRFVCSNWDSQHNVSMRQIHLDDYVASLATIARGVSPPTEGTRQDLRQKVALLYQSCEAVAHRHRDDTGQFRDLLAQGG